MTGPAPRAASLGTRSAVVILVIVAGAAAFGDAAAMVTLMLRLSRAADSQWAVTALLFAMLGPSAVAAPLAARILARGSAWRTLTIASACQALAAAALIEVRGTGPTLLLVVVLGAGLALTQPGLLQLTPAVVGYERLAWTNSLTTGVQWTAWTAGPVAGGALCAAGLASAALLTEAATFVLAAACFVMLSRFPAAGQPAATPGAATEPSPAGRGGAFAYLVRDRGLAQLIAAGCVTSGCVAMTGVAEVFFARHVLRTGSIGFALLSSAWFAGMVAGTLLAPRASTWRPVLTVVGGIGLAGAGVICTALSSVLPVALLAYGVAGVGFGLQTVLIRSLIQLRATGPQRGPVCGFWVAADMSAQLAGYLVGGVAMLAGARVTLAIAGAGLCTAGGAGVVALSARRNLVVREVPHD